MSHLSRTAALVIVGLTALLSGCRSGGLASATPDERELEGRAIQLLVRATQDEQPVVCANAIESLVRIAPDQAQAQIRAALRSAEPLARFAACVATGDLRDRQALSDLRSLNSDPDQRVRLAAAYARYRCGEKDAGETLSSTLRNSANEKLRADAAWLIGRLSDRAALVRLRSAAERDPSPYVAANIHCAMAALGDDAMLDRVIQYTLKSDNITRLVALQALVELGNARAQRALIYKLGDKGEFLQSRLIAARALGKIGLRDGYALALASLSEQRSDPVETMTIRSNAALALGAIGDRQALPALGKLAETEADAQTQIAAACAICEIVRGARPLR